MRFLPNYTEVWQSSLCTKLCARIIIASLKRYLGEGGASLCVEDFTMCATHGAFVTVIDWSATLLP